MAGPTLQPPLKARNGRELYVLGIARNSTSDQARVSAAQALLDRGWGKAIQPLSSESGGSIQIVIRQIVDIGKEEPRLIEHGDGCDEAYRLERSR
jgi:hypothetical protein